MGQGRTGQEVSRGALRSWEFRYCRDKDQATKKKKTGYWQHCTCQTHRRAAIIWVGGTSNHIHVKLRNATRVARELSGLKLRQYTTLSFVKSWNAWKKLSKHARLDFLSQRKHTTSL